LRKPGGVIRRTLARVRNGIKCGGGGVKYKYLKTKRGKDSDAME